MTSTTGASGDNGTGCPRCAGSRYLAWSDLTRTYVAWRPGLVCSVTVECDTCRDSLTGPWRD